MPNTPQQFARWCRQRPARLEAEIARAEAQTLREARQAAVRLSSGGFSSAQLRRLGHPYATRRPAPPQNPAIVNAQSGRFRASWRTQGPRKKGRGTAGRLVNTDPNGKYLLGTRKAIARPIREAVIALVRPRRAQRLRAAVRRALRH